MSQSPSTRGARPRAVRRVRPPATVALLALALQLAGCGSGAGTKPASHPATTATQPLALAPPQRTPGRRQPIRRPGSVRETSRTAPVTAANPAPVASTPCPAGEKRTFTGLCYSPAAQTRLVQKLGPCPAGQVVADNGACQPLSSKPPRTPHGSVQGSRPAARGPGFDTVFH